jgi:hypothetical protein
MMAHVLVAADKARKKRDLAQSDRARETAGRFLADAEHEKLSEKVKHARLLPAK